MDTFAAARAFVRSAELGSFSKAAQELAVKVSTVSRQIGELERDMGIALFNRSTRGLVLTEGGHTFLAHARQAIEAMNAARAVTMALNETPRGVLRVTLPPAFGRREVLPLLPAFLERYPAIDLDTVITDEILNLIDGSIDLALRVGELKESGLVSRRLAPHRLHACASRGYLERAGMPKQPRDLEKHSCIGGAAARWQFARGARSVIVEPKWRFRSNDLEALLAMTAAGAGIALLPSWLIAATSVERVLSAWTVNAGSNTAIWAVYPPKKTVSSKVRAFVDFLVERLAPDAKLIPTARSSTCRLLMTP